MSRLSLADLVTFHGFSTDIEGIYGEFDVLVVPSVAPEPFGLVCLEAMARGIPVIAPSVGGPAEIVVDGETGLLVEPGNPEALATAIRFFYEHQEEIAQFGARGAQRARSEFRIERYAAEIRATCLELIGDKAEDA